MAEWVATDTFVNEAAGMFYEAGGVYDHEPQWKAGAAARALLPDEPTVACPRCGQRFAATDDRAAAANRNLHFDGDADCPSICKNLPPRKHGLFSVVSR